MKLYIDIDTGEIRRELSGPKLAGLILYLRDILNPLEISFTQAGQVVTADVLADSALLRCGLKATPSGALLAGSTTYVIAGDAANVVFSLNTTELIAYFTSNVGAGAREAQFVFEIRTIAADVSARQTYAQLTVTVRRDVNRDDDVDPTDALAGIYLLRGDLFDTDGHSVTNQFPAVRGDINTYSAARAIATPGRPLPMLFIFYITNAWETWTLRAKAGSGEDDDGISFLAPDDYNVSTNNVTFAKEALQ